MYIEPCCAENQLPRLLRQAGAHAVMFQTSGDVTISHLMKSVMLLSGERPRTLTLALPTLSAEVVRLLRRYMTLEWVAHLNLITSDTTITQHPSPLTQIGVPMDRITYAPVADASCMGLLMFAGDTHTVAITGQLEPTPSQGLHLYSALLGPSGSPAIRSFTDPITALIRARKVDIPAEAEPKAEKPKAVRKKSRTPKGQNKL
jgi:hypothetical protein